MGIDRIIATHRVICKGRVMVYARSALSIIYVSFNASGSNVVLCNCSDNHVDLLYLFILLFVITLSSLVILSYCRSSLVYRSL